MPLSEEKEREYVESGGTRCPHCGSENMETGAVQIDGPDAWADVQCTGCGEEWRDCYKLIGILPL